MLGNDSSAAKRARLPQRGPQPPRFIVIEGPLRVGKTTLARVLSDFLMEKDRIFANLNLDDEELKLYERYYEALTADIPAPDLVIYLQATPEVLRARIAKKASRDESHIAPEYIEEVARGYEHFFFRYAASDLLVINTSDIDFVERSEDLQLLLKRLQEPVKGTQYFLPLGASE